jgi:hypothetical protein
VSVGGGGGSQNFSSLIDKEESRSQLVDKFWNFGEKKTRRKNETVICFKLFMSHVPHNFFSHKIS